MDEVCSEIPKAETNLEKGHTYKENMKRYKKALSSGFYFEKNSIFNKKAPVRSFCYLE